MSDIRVIKHSNFETWRDAPVALIHTSREVVWCQRLARVQEALFNNRGIEAYLLLDDLRGEISQDFVGAWRLDGEGAVKELEEDE